MTVSAETARTAASIDPATEPGFVALTVADLARSVAYYTGPIGLTLLDRDGARATLGVDGRPLLALTEDPGARPWPRGGRSYTGLYHFAILVPTRADLGRWLRHWFSLGLPVPGQGDHLVSEALYLEDPDGHGIEVYRDRPREEWTFVDGRPRMGTGPVDIRGLLDDAEREGRPWSGMPAATRVGHIHLQVGDVAEAADFYHGVLGFDVVARMPAALFVSAGGYHHHLGLNVWHSRGAGAAPTGTVRLRAYTLDLPTDDARAAVVARLDAAGVTHTPVGDAIALDDPWGNRILLVAGRTGTARAAADLIGAAG